MFLKTSTYHLHAFRVRVSLRIGGNCPGSKCSPVEPAPVYLLAFLFLVILCPYCSPPLSKCHPFLMLQPTIPNKNGVSFPTFDYTQPSSQRKSPNVLPPPPPPRYATISLRRSQPKRNENNSCGFCPPRSATISLNETPKDTNPSVMRTAVVSVPPPRFATISLNQTPKVTNPSLVIATAVVLRNSITNCSLMTMSCQSWSTNSWYVSAWGLMDLPLRPHVIA